MSSALDGLEDVPNRPWYNALVNPLATLHGVRLSCACLSIGENGPIITLKHRLDDRQGSVLKD